MSSMIGDDDGSGGGGGGISSSASLSWFCCSIILPFLKIRRIKLSIKFLLSMVVRLGLDMLRRLGERGVGLRREVPISSKRVEYWDGREL